MSYNHAGDLPDNYIFHDATNIIKNPGLRSIWHEGAEKGNFLNEIGHSAIQRSLMSMAGSDDSEFGGLGATIYEIVTMPEFTGANLTDTPTYHDPSGMSVAMRTAFTPRVSLRSKHYRQLTQTSPPSKSKPLQRLA